MIFYYTESAKHVPYNSVPAVTGVAVGASLIWVIVTEMSAKVTQVARPRLNRS